MLLCLSACASSPEAKSPHTAVVETIASDVTQMLVAHEGSGIWRITMALPEPVTEFVFETTPHLPLRERWKISGEGLRLERRGARDVLVGSVPFKQFSLEVASDTRLFPGGYSLSQQLGEDDGWLLFTGHFLGGAPGECPGNTQLQPPCAQAHPFAFSIVPASGEHLWVNGEVQTTATRWTTDREEDAATFIYFGKRLPQRIGPVQWLLPGNFPEWISQAVQEALPEFLQQFAQGFDQSVDGELQIVMNQTEGSGSFSASVLGSFIQFEFQDARWRTPNKQALEGLLDTLAHEAAHLWNGGRFSHDHATGDSWLHEGGATAAASILMRRRGMPDSTFFEQRSTQLNECLEYAQVPLRRLGQRGLFHLYYSCGALIELVIEGKLRARGLDAFAHWRTMYGALEANEYSAATYMDAVVTTTADTALGEWIGRWRETGLADREELLHWLRTSGLRLEAGVSGTDWKAALDVVRPLVKNDCKGGFSISVRQEGMILHGLDSCAVSTQDFLVDRLAGYSLPAEVAQAFAAVQQACGSKGAVEITGRLQGDPAATDISSRMYPCEQAPQLLKIVGWQQP